MRRFTHLLATGVAVAAIAAPAGLAASPNDPCLSTGGVCKNVPEAPFTLVLPAVGAGVVAVFLGVGALRRRRSAPTVTEL